MERQHQACSCRNTSTPSRLNATTITTPCPTPNPPTTLPTTDPVIVSLHDLRSGSIPLPTLVRAFSPTSLGILLVRDLPAAFPALRSRALSNSSRLAHLPATKLERLTNERAKYLVGWSHGKETLRPGVVDRGKGSYYVGCGFYRSRRGVEEGEESGRDAEDDMDDGAGKCEGFEEYTAPNIWPDEEDIPGFRTGAEELITMIIDVAVLVARACDRYAIGAVEGYQEGYLERIVKTSTTTKARLLHYFPTEAKEAGTNGTVGPVNGDVEDDNNNNEEEDDWCATHLDHGCLTGLTSAMFVDESVSSTAQPPQPLEELPKSPGPSAGLYIRSRGGEAVKVNIPRDCLAFQTGEALELITKGKFKAVPHFVRGVPPDIGARIARNTLAVFTQPNLGEFVDRESNITFGDFARGVVAKNTT